MKAKQKLLQLFFIAIVMIINVYLLILNISVNEYETKTEVKTSANYIYISKKTETVFVKFINTVEKIKKEKTIVYDGKTLDELANQLDKSLSSTISGKGELIATYSLEKGVDPYMATAIILHETGCRWGCSYLVRECNNVGGQKGKGCGNYSSFNSLDEGIIAFIDNLERNYISYGLNTPEAINPKYAEDKGWSKKVNKYIEDIKAQ